MYLNKRSKNLKVAPRNVQSESDQIKIDTVFIICKNIICKTK